MTLFRRARPDRDGLWIVAGLGNPGERYERTRHNAGAMTLDVLAERAGARMKRHKTRCLVAETDISGQRAALARPLSYMNESGRPLGELARWYGTPAGRVIVLHDEIDIPFGDVRVKSGGGTAGHNGLKSIAAHLKTNDFVRIRVGVGRPRAERGAVGHVLGPFSRQEAAGLQDLLERAADAAEDVIARGVERAMTDFNART